MLKRPDFYPNSCCGEADAYEADIYQRNADGSYDVEITEGKELSFPTIRAAGSSERSKVHVPATR